MIRVPALLIISLSLAFLFSAQSVAAQTATKGVLTVSPAYVEVTLEKPGEEQEVTISYTNNSDQTITLELFPLDFAQTDANGTIGLLLPEAGSYAYGLASYLSLQADRITLDPRDMKSFQVTVTNRPNLSPGGHYGAVVARVVSSDPTRSGAQVAPSVSTLIFLRKTGGERFNLSLRKVNWGGTVMFSYPRTAVLEFQNEGNIHLFPFGTLKVKDIFGRTTYTGVLNTSSFRVMPESRRYIPVRLRKVAFSLPLTINTLTITGTDSLKKTPFQFQTTVLYLNPWFLGLIALMVALVIFFSRRRKKNTKHSLSH